MTISRFKNRILWVAGAFMWLATPSALAGEADVIDATITRTASGAYTISATILHADSGWDHYVDAFEIIAPDGTILAIRTLLHPHENEQPFTRALSGIDIPEPITHVKVRAHDKVHAYGGIERELVVPR